MPDGTTPRRRRRRKCIERKEDCPEVLKDESSDEGEEVEGRVSRQVKRECPVPKPGGIVGEILGFKEKEDRDDRKGARPP